MPDQAHLLPGTLDLLILRAVSLGPLHGYGILLRIAQISGQALMVEQGALYPGLFRLVRQGLLKTKWGVSDVNRRAKFYELTAAGRKRLQDETESWTRLAARTGNGRIRIPRTSVNKAVFTPIPSARALTAAAVNAGDFFRIRNPNRRSRKSVFAQCQPRAACDSSR